MIKRMQFSVVGGIVEMEGESTNLVDDKGIGIDWIHRFYNCGYKIVRIIPE